MSTVPTSGRIWAGAGFALALALILAALWWTTRPKILTTADAVWVLPTAQLAHSAEGEGILESEQSDDLGEIVKLVEADTLQVSEEKSAAVLLAEEALADAEAELEDYLQTMQLARAAIEEAVVMVQEQRENFDYAMERFETLMPLVETGALEPLAASQIQSAYISARASLAQAKFLLGQARREFGTEESRRRTHSRLQRQIAAAQANLARIRDAHDSPLLSPTEFAQQESAAKTDLVSTSGFVEAVFPLSPKEVKLLQPGISGLVFSAGARKNDMPVSATVTQILEVVPLAEINSVAVRLRLRPATLPDWKTFDRLTIPCKVIIPIPKDT